MFSHVACMAKQRRRIHPPSWNGQTRITNESPIRLMRSSEMNFRHFCVLALLLASPLRLRAEGTAWYQKDFPPEEFKARWAAVFRSIGPDAIATVQGIPQTNGFIYPRQSNEFYYLSGIETPGSYILLDGRTRRATLFLPPRNARLEAAEGKVLSAEDAALVRQLTGADNVLSTDLM